MEFFRTFLLGMAAFALPVQASVVLGYVGTESDVPIAGQEDVIVYNVTGPVWGCSTSAGTPICTAVTFENVVLTVDGTPIDLGDVGPGVTETYTLPGGIFADGAISSLSLSATLSATALTDDVGNTFNVSSSLLLTGLATDGSLPAISAPLARLSVPEPSSLTLLLGLGLTATVVVLRGHRYIS